MIILDTNDMVKRNAVICASVGRRIKTADVDRCTEVAELEIWRIIFLPQGSREGRVRGK